MRDLANHINDSCTDLRVHALVRGADANSPQELLIKSLEWDKGSAATLIGERLLEHGRREGISAPEFLLVVGDDGEDEAIYRWARGWERERVSRDVVTVTVSARNTEAKKILSQGVVGEFELVCLDCTRSLCVCVEGISNRAIGVLAALQALASLS
jgi:hypothetical protein